MIKIIDRTNILHEFFNSKSDANISLDATAQEQLENDFQDWVTKGKGECFIVDSFKELCVESLHPKAFEKFDEVKESLKFVRNKLRIFNYEGMNDE